MKINYNVSAIIANAALSVNEGRYNVSSERLSTGFKVNHAKENPSGIAIAKRMNAQLRGLDRASQNASTAISVVSTAEGALTEMQSMVQRINELAIQAASGVKTDDDRAAIQDEIKELKEELDRMMEDTEFNGKKLLNGDCDLKGYSDVDGVTAGYYSDEVPIGKYSFSVTQPLPRDAEGNIDLQEGDVTLLMDGSETAFPTDAMVSCNGDKVTVKAAGEFEVQFYMSDAYDAAGTSDITLDLTGMGAMRVQIGANEGQAIEIRIPEVSLKTMGLTDIDLSTTEGAQEAIELSKQANTFISSIRSRIGAYENRLEHTGNSIDISEENMTAAFSRLMDTDMAEEMTEYTNQQVLNQAGISILTQANQRPSEMLQLLQ